MNQTDPARSSALALLARFRERLLPGTMRRISLWKGIPRRTLADLQEEVDQELALDCLEHAAQILRLSERQRHARWMRCAERQIYWHLTRHHRIDDLPREPASPAAGNRSWPAVQLPELVRLQNGRLNLCGSMQANGQGRSRMRKRLDHAAAALGWSAEQQRFWQARVVEALTGLAADLLRERGLVRLLAEPRRPPDPERRLRRLRRLALRFPIHPSTRPVRSVLRPWSRQSRLDRADPVVLLEQAARLGPRSPAPWLWLFEACCARGDLTRAATALRRGRRAGPERAAVVLARARLLEARAKLAVGIALVRRASRRWPHERALQQALAATRCA